MSQIQSHGQSQHCITTFAYMTTNGEESTLRTAENGSTKGLILQVMSHSSIT